MQEKDNLAILQKALEDELLSQIISKMDLYDVKITEIFTTLSDLEEIMIMQLDEAKKIQGNFTELEIDAKISKAMEEFENEIKTTQKVQKSKNTNLIVYFLIAIIFLLAGLVIKN